MIAHFLTAAVLVAVPSEEERIKGAFFGSLVADALCLGSHYEYDAATIKQAYGEEYRYVTDPMGIELFNSTNALLSTRPSLAPFAKAKANRPAFDPAVAFSAVKKFIELYPETFSTIGGVSPRSPFASAPLTCCPLRAQAAIFSTTRS